MDWEDPSPEKDMERARVECENPGTLVLCLGTSLRILPVGDLPLLASKFAIVNPQQTHGDSDAALITRGTADDVVLVQLGVPSWQEEPLPPIERVWKPPKPQASQQCSASRLIERGQVSSLCLNEPSDLKQLTGGLAMFRQMSDWSRGALN